jgi:hypothetical protein
MQKKLKICVSIIFLGVFLFLSCRKELSCEGCYEKKQPPVAAAGNDKIIILPTDSVSLDGSASRDPDGSISQWLWKKISGPASSLLINPQLPECKIKALVKGYYRFELTVTDNGGLSAKDTVMITVDAGFVTNHPPVANAGADQIITLPTNTVSLNGSGSSDPDNNISSYQWTKISGPLSFSINNSNAAQTQVTNFEQGVYEFELKVTDAGGLISKDTIRITVLPVTATEIIFTNQVLINLCYQPDMPGACWVNSDSPSYGIIISDTANALPNSLMSILGVWVKMDTSSVWEQVPVNCWQYPAPYPQSNFTYCVTPDTLSVWSWFFSFQNLAGRKADVKISF